MITGRVFNIQRFALHDGPGIRTTVFLKGCPLTCSWCHNPEGMRDATEIVVVASRCIACGACVEACPQGLPSGTDGGFAGDRTLCTACGACAAVCPTEARQLAGRELTVGELMREVGRDRLVFDDSGGGVTFSGGEPFRQAAFLRASLEACRREEIHTAVDTSGHADRHDLLEIAPLADLVLYDLKLMDDARHRAWTGVSNRTILDHLDRLARIHPAIWLRVPVIPGVNDDPANLQAVAAYAARYPSVRRVSLLPYHQLGADKLARLGHPPSVAGIRPPSAEQMAALATAFADTGIPTTIGG